MEVKMLKENLKRTKMMNKVRGKKKLQLKSIYNKNNFKKISAFTICVIISIMSVITSSAAEKDISNNTVYSNSINYLTEDDINNNEIFSTQEISTLQKNGTQFLGGINCPLSSMSNNNNYGVKISVITGQVWVKSYATYTKQKGVSVYTELYVPWYFFPNPKFTIMSGNVKVKLNSKTTEKTFTKTAKSTSTISKTVNTGAKASAGTKGTVNVYGIASGYNIAAGAGAFSTSYSIIIPKS